MKMKKKMSNVKRDRKIFNRTAVGIKAGNLSTFNQRGGKAW